MNKELTKVFQGEPLDIEFIEGGEEFMIDVSGVAKKYGTQFHRWSESRATLLKRAVLEEWDTGEDPRKMSKSELLSFKNSLRQKVPSPKYRALVSVEHGNNGHSKIHNSLLTSFARFLSVDFEIWSDGIVYDLLIGKKQLTLDNQTKAIEAVNKKYEKVKAELDKTKENLSKKTNHKLVTYADQTQSLRKWIVDKFPEYDISERELWRFLANHADEFMRVTPATKTSNVIVNMDYGKNVGDSIAFNDSIIPYIKEFIGENSIDKLPQQGTFNF